MKLHAGYVFLAVFIVFMIYLHIVEFYLYQSVFYSGLAAAIPYFAAILVGLVCNIIGGIYFAYLFQRITFKYHHEYFIINFICLLFSWIIVSLLFFYGAFQIVSLIHAMIPFLCGLYFNLKTKKKATEEKPYVCFIIPISIFLTLSILLIPVLK